MQLIDKIMKIPEIEDGYLESIAYGILKLFDNDKDFLKFTEGLISCQITITIDRYREVFTSYHEDELSFDDIVFNLNQLFGFIYHGYSQLYTSMEANGGVYEEYDFRDDVLYTEVAIREIDKYILFDNDKNDPHQKPQLILDFCSILGLAKISAICLGAKYLSSESKLKDQENYPDLLTSFYSDISSFLMAANLFDRANSITIAAHPMSSLNFNDVSEQIRSNENQKFKVYGSKGGSVTHTRKKIIEKIADDTWRAYPNIPVKQLAERLRENEIKNINGYPPSISAIETWLGSHKRNPKLRGRQKQVKFKLIIKENKL